MTPEVAGMDPFGRIERHCGDFHDDTAVIRVLNATRRLATSC